MSHDFSLHHFTSITRCHVCEGILWGIMQKQGLICRKCQIAVHERCTQDANSIDCIERPAEDLSDDEAIALEVYNECDQSVLVGVFNDDTRVLQAPVNLLAGNAKEIMVDSKSRFALHILAFHKDEPIPEEIDVSDVAQCKVGLFREFHVNAMDEIIVVTGGRVGQWFRDLGQKFAHIIEPISLPFEKNKDKARQKCSRIDEIASVRIGRELHSDEASFISSRMNHVKTSLERLFDVTECRMPRISLCMSGGGIRACLASAGFVEGLSDWGLLDCCSYMAGLSGGSWFVGSWLASGMDIKAYADTICRSFTSHPARMPHDGSSLIFEALKDQILFKPLSLVEPYAALLGNVLLYFDALGDKRLLTRLSQLDGHLKHTVVPFPLAVAVQPISDHTYRWFEFSPYETSAVKEGVHVPMWSFGRRFVGGKSVNSDPEPSLANVLGCCGSAFAANLGELSRIKGDDSHPGKSVLKSLSSTSAGSVRISTAKFNNPSLGMYASGVSPRSRYIELIDAGIDINAPFPPLLERQSDIIICLDASRDFQFDDDDSDVLRRAEAYAQKNGYPFPPIDYAGVGRRLVSVFRAEGAPTVVYVPLEKIDDDFDPREIILDNGFLHFMNFTYTQAQAQQLRELTRKLAMNAMPVILDAIRPYL